MRILSPLSNLCDTLDQVKSSAALYETTLRKNEAATRAVLVDPILRALGWETANTYMVEVEKTLSQTRVDYALYDSNADVKVIVEAKPLGGNLSQQSTIMNLVTYAFTYGLQDIFLTDGLIWQHFTNFQPGNVAPSKTLDLAKDGPVDCAGYLVQRLDAAKFWPEQQTIDTLAQQVTQLENALSTLQQEVGQLRASGRSIESTPQGISADDITGTPPKLDISPSQYMSLSSLPDMTGRKPVALRLPDGSERPVKMWKDVLRECCKFALASNPNIPIPFPDRSGRKVNLFSSIRPADGISYLEERYRGQAIFVYTNYDANNSVSNANHILRQVPDEKAKMEASVALAQTPSGS